MYIAFDSCSFAAGPSFFFSGRSAGVCVRAVVGGGDCSRSLSVFLCARLFL